MRCKMDWGRVLLVYVLQIYSSTAIVSDRVQLEAPKYVELHNTATLFCNHTISENLLHKIEFSKNGQKIFQFIKDRKPPTIEHLVAGFELQPTADMNVIKLKNVGYEAAGEYSCDVSMDTPIFTMASNVVQMQVIVPQSEDPRITFRKPHYVVGEILEANCTSSPARPAPHLTWFINGKEVDISLVTPFPSRNHHQKLQSSVAQLSIKVSALHAGENGRLEISCNSTIPNYPLHGQYADCRSQTQSIKIISIPLTTSASSSINREYVVISSTISLIIAINDIINLQFIMPFKLLGVNLIL